MKKIAQRPGSREARDRDLGELTLAALALERELDRFEELAATARRLPLDTRRGVERAAKATTEAAEGQLQVNATLGALVAAITAARERHEANALALQARGEEIRARAAEVSELYERFSALGDEGKLINQLVQDAAASQREAATPAQVRALVSDIEGIEERMSKLVEIARALNQAATAATINDLAEQTDALRQQVAAAKNKLGLLRKNLTAQLEDASKLN
ncbi:MAG: hypothetical protein ABI134_28435 [Byssovorax sp.]